MSNTPSSPVVFRVPQAVLTFVVLLTALGALLLFSNNIDPRAVQRAQNTLAPTLTFTPSITPTPVDPFANVSFAPWTSQDGLITLERPASWEAQRVSQLPWGYVLFAPGANNVFLRVLALPRDQAVPDQPPTATAEDLLRAYFASQGNVGNVQVRPVTVDGMTGGGARQTVEQQDPMTGQPTSIDVEMWFLDIDPTHLLIFQGIAPSPQWAQMEPIVARATSTLRLDKAGIIAVLVEAFGPAATAPATGEATAQPTAAATAEGTPEVIGPTLPTTPSAPTPAATPVATAEPTAEATAVPTAEPTAEATGTF